MSNVKASLQCVGLLLLFAAGDIQASEDPQTQSDVNQRVDCDLTSDEILNLALSEVFSAPEPDLLKAFERLNSNPDFSYRTAKSTSELVFEFKKQFPKCCTAVQVIYEDWIDRFLLWIAGRTEIKVHVWADETYIDKRTGRPEYLWTFSNSFYYDTCGTLLDSRPPAFDKSYNLILR